MLAEHPHCQLCGTRVQAQITMGDTFATSCAENNLGTHLSTRASGVAVSLIRTSIAHLVRTTLLAIIAVGSTDSVFVLCNFQRDCAAADDAKGPETFLVDLGRMGLGEVQRGRCRPTLGHLAQLWQQALPKSLQQVRYCPLPRWQCPEPWQRAALVAALPSAREAVQQRRAHATPAQARPARLQTVPQGSVQRPIPGARPCLALGTGRLNPLLLGGCFVRFASQASPSDSNHAFFRGTSKVSPTGRHLCDGGTGRDIPPVARRTQPAMALNSDRIRSPGS